MPFVKGDSTGRTTHLQAGLLTVLIFLKGKGQTADIVMGFH